MKGNSCYVLVVVVTLVWLDTETDCELVVEELVEVDWDVLVDVELLAEEVLV